MSKPKTIKVNDDKKVPKGAIPLTPRNIRKQIIRLEIIQQKIQMAIPKERNILKKNRLINLMERTRAQVRQLYFMLHKLKVKGDVQKEIEEKLKVDWDKKKCPKCEKAKLDDDGKCLSPQCDYVTKKETVPPADKELYYKESGKPDVRVAKEVIK